jgi:hypothetical protein
MSRKMVRVGVFLLVASLLMLAIRTYGDDPFGNEAPAVGEKPKPNAKPPVTKPAESLDDPFGSEPSLPATREKPSTNRPAKKSAAKEPPAKPSQPFAAISKPKSPRQLHGGEDAILRALKQESTLEFCETPLKDVIEYISEKYLIPVRLDPSGLKDAGVDPETPVTCNVSGISLQSALEIILDELQLKWSIHHDVLMLTSPSKAVSDDFMYTRVYDVTDLITPVPSGLIRFNPLSTPDAMLDAPAIQSDSQQPTMSGPCFSTTPIVGSSKPSTPGVVANVGAAARTDSNTSDSPVTASFHQLMDLIQNTVVTKTWMDNGGSGTMSDLQPRFLVINQTRDAHQQIEKLLSGLRTGQQAVPSFKIELRWLWLDAAKRGTLFADNGRQSKVGSDRAVDQHALSQLTDEVPSFHAIANCLNGQYAALSVGDRRALITSAIPIVDGGIAYEPLVRMPNIGLTVRVQPVMLPEDNLVRLAVTSSITRWTPQRAPVVVSAAWGPESHVNAQASQSPANPLGPVMGHMGMGGMGGGFMQVASENVKTAAPATSPANAPVPQPKGGFGDFLPPAQPATTAANGSTNPTAHTSISSHGSGSSSCPIDLPVMPTQEFGTTLRVPLGKPVVVGSVTFAPAGDAGVGEAKKDAMEVYLIATTSVVKKAAAKKANPYGA